MKDGLEKIIREYPKDFNLTELQNEISWFNWTSLLKDVLPKEISIEPIDSILVEDPEYLKEIGNLIELYPKR